MTLIAARAHAALTSTVDGDTPHTATLAMPRSLLDRYGRSVRDLRLSITDRCNLRCTYCMPAEGLTWLPPSSLLSADEIVRIARIGVELLGVERIRLTGGEPLLRKDLEDIAHGLATLRTRAGTVPDLALTTNGLGLTHRAAGLRAAGITRINVSIDSLDSSRYATITRRSRLSDVLDGVRAATYAGFSPMKINAVALRAGLDTDVPSLLETCLREGWQLRFIEHMPLGPRQDWRSDLIVSAADILASLTSAGFRLTSLGRPDRRPAALWQVEPQGDRRGGQVGIISSVTAPFCGDCDRTRVTADGQLMTCLFSHKETDLRALVRGGADDATIAQAWAAATWLKPAAHGTNSPGFFSRPTRSMSAIGG